MEKLKPSKNFLENINMYKQMHDEGYKKIDGGYEIVKGYHNIN